MKRVNRVLCVMLSLLMLAMPCLPGSAAAAEAGYEAGAQPAQTEYFAYYDACDRVPFLTESIRLPVSAGRLSGEAAQNQ